jgi:RNA recognition motif-containing protein
MKSEHYDNRTIVIKNIPNEYKQKDLLKVFHDYGAVVGIELPMINKQLMELNQQFGKVD